MNSDMDMGEALAWVFLLIGLVLCVLAFTSYPGQPSAPAQDSAPG